MSFAESLYPAVRKEVGRAFGAPVGDYYNCEEVGNVAWECPEHAGRMHINESAAIVEIVDDRGMPLPPGGVGRILLTNLYNWTMPFIRYEICDRAANQGEGRAPVDSPGLR